MVEDSPTFQVVAPRIKAFLEKAPLVIAHNARFDCDMIEVEFERIRETIAWPPVICTVEQSMHYSSKRLSLTQLYEYMFKEKFTDAHRAGGDVSALVRIAIEMRKRGDA
jgi:DNA polymerase III epsilon subunit-like protein